MSPTVFVVDDDISVRESLDHCSERRVAPGGVRVRAEFLSRSRDPRRAV